MTYSILKPDSGPSPAIDYAQIQTNFSTFGTAIAANHIGMNLFKQGFHGQVILEKQTVEPTIVGNEAIVFCKDAPSNLGTQPQLFSKIPKFLPTPTDSTQADNTSIQLTYNQVNTAGTVDPKYTYYQSFLPGGYILYFGTCTDITATITLSPAPTNILIAVATPNTLTTTTFFPFTVATQILSSNTFKILSTLNTPAIAYSFGFYAIGKV